MTAVMYAVDLGGTWIRLRHGAEVTGSPSTRRMRSPSLLNCPNEEVSTLRRRLIDLLAEQVPVGACAALSCGAAMDEEQGIIYGSAPLWGSAREPFHLLAELTRVRPDVRWYAVNDVTAGLADFCARYATDATRQAGYLTVSSGIGLRLADINSRRIPVDGWGMQGEVGHCLAQFPAGIQPPALPACECGAIGHIGSVSSGPGIRRLAEQAGLDCGTDFEYGFAKRLTDRDPTARKVLRIAIAPIAELLRTLWCIVPHLDLVGIGGGVVENLREHYRAELFGQLSEKRSYVDRGRDERWLEAHIRLCGAQDVDNLHGAVRMLTGELQVVR
ncbi:ROK family protein [Nocardia abscessus]|uniref:ROK family protein n=1 Tax=Nocardia abscessus TaxID=120957 RepID=UPI0024546AB4|nr:ROK family protein [Nocardia abscessus]